MKAEGNPSIGRYQTTAPNAIALTGSLTADLIEGMDKAVVDPDYAFFKTTITAENGTLTAGIARAEDTSFATYANNGNAARIAAAAEVAGEGAFFEGMLGGTKAEVAQTLDSLSDDAILSTRNASIVNGMTLYAPLRIRLRASAAAVRLKQPAVLAFGLPVSAVGLRSTTVSPI